MEARRALRSRWSAFALRLHMGHEESAPYCLSVSAPDPPSTWKGLCLTHLRIALLGMS